MTTTPIVEHEVLKMEVERQIPYLGQSVGFIVEASQKLLEQVSSEVAVQPADSVEGVLFDLVARAIPYHGDAVCKVLELQLDREAYISKSAGRVALLTDGLSAIDRTANGATILSGLILAVTDPEAERGQSVVEDFLAEKLQETIRETLFPALTEQPRLFDTTDPDIYLVKSTDKNTGETKISVHPVLSKKLELLCDRVGVVIRDFQGKGLSREQISKIYYRVKANVLKEVTENKER